MLLATGGGNGRIDFTRNVRNVQNAQSYAHDPRILVKLPTLFSPLYLQTTDLLPVLFARDA